MKSLVAALALLPTLAHADPVRVLYAGSLVSLMERGIGPAFDHPGEAFEGFPGGSKALVNQITAGLRPADVFISANPALNARLGSRVRWYVTFARSPLVIGYDPASRFAARFAHHPWYEVLAQPGIRIGRTDPALDPKGVLTIELLTRTEQAEHHPGLAATILAHGEILPEETLVGRLQSGELDAGFFYSTETADLRIPSITVAPDVALEATYSAAILADAANATGAAGFVAFLLGPKGQALMRAHGLVATTPELSGDRQAVPAAVAAALHAGR